MEVRIPELIKGWCMYSMMYRRITMVIIVRVIAGIGYHDAAVYIHYLLKVTTI